MTASSPVTMGDLVAGLVFKDSDQLEWRVMDTGEEYYLVYDTDQMNLVDLSSDGLTITFSGGPENGPTFVSFTFNA